MAKHWLSAILVLFATATSAGEPVIATDASPAVTVAVLEPAPLMMPPLQLDGLASAGSVSPGLSGYQSAGIVNLLVVLANLSTANSGETSRALQAQLDGAGVWVPTREVGAEVVRQLAGRGTPAMLEPGLLPYPDISNRDYTTLGENWQRPIRAWWRRKQAVAAAMPGTAVARLEVSLYNYELVHDVLVLQVAIKQIDPVTG
ncbi:MAG TPA: hypothetical protein VJ484_00085, partial [Lysobacter sp.]|nr:hypothetical protein [Lysobacter sp.]